MILTHNLLRQSRLRVHPRWILRPLLCLSSQEEAGVVASGAPKSATPGVGTRSKTRQAELDAAEATQAAHAVWPEKPDRTAQIQHMTRDIQISDRPQDPFREIQINSA